MKTVGFYTTFLLHIFILSSFGFVYKYMIDRMNLGDRYCWKYRSYIVLIYLFILVFGICLERYLACNDPRCLQGVHVVALVVRISCSSSEFFTRTKETLLNCGVSSSHSCARWFCVPTPLVSCVTNPPILFYCTLPRKSWRYVLTGTLYLFTQYMFD